MKKIIFILGIIVTFLVGFTLNDLIGAGAKSSLEQEITPEEVLYPADHIKEYQLEVYPDKIIIHLQNPSLTRYLPTNSMIPTLSSTSQGIEVPLTNKNQLHKGDIIAYQTTEGLIVHRIIELGNDKEGLYVKTKGDNNKYPDPYKVRMSQIKYVTLGVIF